MKKKKIIQKKLSLVYKYILDKNAHYILLAFVPFFLLDFFTKILSRKVLLLNIVSFVPNLFTFLWIFIIVGAVMCSKKKLGKTIYTIFFIIALGLFFVNNIYFSMTGNFFDFHMMGLVSEGSYYFWDSIVNANIFVYIFALITIIIFIYANKKIPYQRKYSPQKYIFLLIIFIFSYCITPLLYGEANVELTWNTWRNPRNIYNNFNDNNKSFSVTGLYEYSIRNFYITYLKTKKTDNEQEIEFLSNIFKDKSVGTKNKYTGKLKDKNIIFLQLEGIDNWLLNKNTMPNTYALLNNSINFNNHYSYYNGGGSTFNSEFAVNTGFVTPITYTQNAYTFNKNDFPYSMAKLYKNEGYEANVFHMNSGEYYSRRINYSTWGYSNYYSLMEQGNYKNNEYHLDTELINNELFYEKQFKQEGKFINYLITFSVHLPFTEESGVCKQLLTNQLSPLLLDEQLLTEEECVKIQAKETDDMVGLLMKALKDNNLDDKTILVVFTDHYLYTLSDETILAKYKDTKTNLINKTPFFIWSKNMKKVTINKASSQVDILPTLLNLTGIEYDKNNYTGNDILDNNNQGLVFFSDMSWYDGKNYVKDGKAIIGKPNQSVIENKSSLVDYIVKKNDLLLKYNYFKQIEKLAINDPK